MKIIYSLFYFGQARRSKEDELVENQEASRIICGGEINGDAIITSPGFDDPDRGYYYNNLNCTWDINIPGATSVTIFPEFFEVESSYEDYGGDVEVVCNYDWLSVFLEFQQERNHTYRFCSLGMPEYDEDGWEPYTTEAPRVQNFGER